MRPYYSFFLCGGMAELLWGNFWIFGFLRKFGDFRGFGEVFEENFGVFGHLRHEEIFRAPQKKLYLKLPAVLCSQLCAPADNYKIKGEKTDMVYHLYKKISPLKNNIFYPDFFLQIISISESFISGVFFLAFYFLVPPSGHTQGDYNGNWYF